MNVNAFTEDSRLITDFVFPDIAAPPLLASPCTSSLGNASSSESRFSCLMFRPPIVALSSSLLACPVDTDSSVVHPRVLMTAKALRFHVGNPVPSNGIVVSPFVFTIPLALADAILVLYVALVSAHNLLNL